MLVLHGFSATKKMTLHYSQVVCLQRSGERHLYRFCLVKLLAGETLAGSCRRILQASLASDALESCRPPLWKPLLAGFLVFTILFGDSLLFSNAMESFCGVTNADLAVLKQENRSSCFLVSVRSYDSIANSMCTTFVSV